MDRKLHKMMMITRKSTSNLISQLKNLRTSSILLVTLSLRLEDLYALYSCWSWSYGGSLELDKHTHSFPTLLTWLEESTMRLANGRRFKRSCQSLEKFTLLCVTYTSLSQSLMRSKHSKKLTGSLSPMTKLLWHLTRWKS